MKAKSLGSIILLACFLNITGIAVSHAQDNKIFTTPDKQPMYPGGKDALLKFIKDNLKYPALADSNKVAGSVTISFVIEKTGGITELEVTKGIGSGCDEEAMRIIRKMPKWYPGSVAGKPVRVLYKITIKFPQ
jgi:periplasmic protein TonB